MNKGSFGEFDDRRNGAPGNHQTETQKYQDMMLATMLHQQYAPPAHAVATMGNRGQRRTAIVIHSAIETYVQADGEGEENNPHGDGGKN